ncbi:MAG: hypothetical protein L0H23_01840 [Luteimonas sp.]|nr:hypothetical protein [Luteimonas sp.]
MRAANRISCNLLATTLALALAACAPAGDSAAGIAPVDDPAVAPRPAATQAGTIDDAEVSAFLASTYGPAAAQPGEWKTMPADAAFKAEGGESDGQVVRSVCERESVTLAGQPAVLLAVCGTVQDAGHPAAGVNDFFLLQRSGDALATVASAHMAEFGSRGSPGEVDIERFGADLYGFVVETGFYNMGQSVGTRHVLLPRGRDFVDAGWFRDSLGNEDWMKGCGERGDCGPGDAYDIDFDLHVDDSDPAAAAYPLLVTETGTACGKPADAQYRMVLDPASMTYAVPAALRRDGCAVAAGQ